MSTLPHDQLTEQDAVKDKAENIRDGYDCQSRAARSIISLLNELAFVLDKLTIDRFDSISDQIIVWVNRSEKANDGRTLYLVVQLVLDKATSTDGSTRTEMYARLCRKIMEQSFCNNEAKTTGGQPFYTYFMDMCQDDFKRTWIAKEFTAAASQDNSDITVIPSNEGKHEDETAPYCSPEHHVALKARRLGLLKFFGELFKLEMLTGGTMHEYIQKLLNNAENPDEQELETLYQLFTTTGKILDTPTAKKFMDDYFMHMKEFCTNAKVSPYVQSLLQDMIELRERKWIRCPETVAASSTFCQPHSLTGSAGFRSPQPVDSVRISSVPQHQQHQTCCQVRMIEDLGSVAYPEGIQSPKPELNVNAKNGKFRYDREFLLQFMSICKEKPDHLPPLDTIGLGQLMLNNNSQRTPGGAPGASAFGGHPPHPMVYNSSQGGPGSSGSRRTRSKRVPRDHDKGSSGGGSSMAFQHQSMPSGMSMGPPPAQIAPLQSTANRWVPQSSQRKTTSEDSPEVVDRKVRGLLNKLTMERFESISDQIIAWANRSEKEKDGRTLIQVIRLVFEKATDEATRSEMYARLCQKMMEQTSPNVQDEGIRNTEGKPIIGRQLFRKYLLNRCHEDFERGWAAKETTTAAAATKANSDALLLASNEGKLEDEVELYSVEYYAAQKAKRQGLGLVKCIGELFKLQMLTERIMHECIKKLLSNVDNPEEEIESLCQLLTTIGQIVDTPRAKQYMDIYFTRMKELCKNPKVSSRMQFMLQDVIELRERKWIPRNAVAAPSTLSQVHENAAKEKVASQRDNYNRQMNMLRGGERGDQPQHNADGWTAAGRLANAGDLSNFGKISKPATITFGYSGVFAPGKKEAKRDSASIGRSTYANMFSTLQSQEDAEAAAAASNSSRPPSCKPKADFTQSGIPVEPMLRRKLQLLPRSKPMEESKDDETPAASAAPSENGEDEVADVPTMSEAKAKKQVGEDMKEFFAIRDLGEAEEYFTKLPSEHRFRLVDALVNKAIESKQADAQLVADLFNRAASKDLCSPASFEEGFMPTAEIIDDIAIDALQAFDLLALMLKGAGLDKDEERRARIAGMSQDSDKLISMLS